MAKAKTDFVKTNKDSLLFVECRRNSNVGTAYTIDRYDISKLSQKEFKKKLLTLFHALRGRNVDRAYFYLEHEKVFEIARNFDINSINFKNIELNDSDFLVSIYSNMKFVDTRVVNDEKELIELICKKFLYQPFLNIGNNINDNDD